MCRPRTAKDVTIQTRIVSEAQTALVMACAEYVAEATSETYRKMKKATHEYEVSYFDYTEMMNDLEPLWHAPEAREDRWEGMDRTDATTRFAREFDLDLGRDC